MKILVCDDDAQDRKLVRICCRKALGQDCLVLEEADGLTLLDTVRKFRPDLILLDIMMPKFDGYSACSLLKTQEDTKRIPVVMLTGLGLELNQKFAEIVGADGYISKPLSQDELVMIVDRLSKDKNE